MQRYENLRQPNLNDIINANILQKEKDFFRKEQKHTFVAAEQQNL